MKPIIISFDGNTPSKKNNKRILKRRSGQMFIAGSQEYHEWHTRERWNVLSQAKAQGLSAPIESLAEIRLLIYYPDQRRRDNSNIWETVADLLVEAKVISDDCWTVTGCTIQIPVFRQGAPGWEARMTPQHEGRLCSDCKAELMISNWKPYNGGRCKECYRVYDKIRHGFTHKPKNDIK